MVVHNGKLIIVTANKQKKVGSNLITASQYLNKAGQTLKRVASIKLTYATNKHKKNNKSR